MLRSNFLIVACLSWLMLAGPVACGGDDDDSGAKSSTGDKDKGGKGHADGGTEDGGGGSGGKTGTGSADGGGANGGGNTGDTSDVITTDVGTNDDCPVVVDDADCDDTQLPFVFVHGTYGSGDNIANVAMLFGSNGYCQDRFVAVEYNSLGDSPVANGTLDALIDKVLKDTGAKQVVLAGHSQGTGHCVDYLGDAAHAAKVAKYINYSGVGTVPNNVPTLSLSSMNDLGGSPHHAPNAEKMITFTDEDHFGVAASKNAFIESWKYLHDGKMPKYTEIQCGAESVTVEGIAETFADNLPQLGGMVEIREIDAKKDARDEGDPLMTVKPDDTGHFKIELKRLQQYEMRAFDKDGKILGHVAFSPFKRSNRLVRLLSPSTNPLVAGFTTDMVKLGDKHTAMVARYLPGAFRHDLGDKLLVDGNDVLTDDNAGKTLITVGLFMSDQNTNQKSDLGVDFSQSFIVGTDVYVDASKPAWVELEINGSKITVPNWPSMKEGMIALTFQ